MVGAQLGPTREACRCALRPRRAHAAHSGGARLSTLVALTLPFVPLIPAQVISDQYLYNASFDRDSQAHGGAQRLPRCWALLRCSSRAAERKRCSSCAAVLEVEPPCRAALSRAVQKRAALDRDETSRAAPRRAASCVLKCCMKLASYTV